MNKENNAYVKEQIEPNVNEQNQSKELSLEEQLELFASLIVEQLLNEPQ